MNAASAPGGSQIVGTSTEAKAADASRTWDAAEAALRRLAEPLPAPGMDSALLTDYERRACAAIPYDDARRS